VKTTKFLSGMAGARARFAMLGAAFVAAMIGLVAPAAALPRLTSVSVGTQSGPLTFGTAGTVTFPVSVTKINSGGSNTQNTVTADLSVTGLAGFSQCANASSPGPCWIFSPLSLSWPGNDFTGSQSSTLTIKTSATVNAGSLSFAVNAVRQGSPGDNASGGGTLSVAKAGQTITFAPLTDKTQGDADFTVSATASSGLAVSFTASGNCTVTGSTVHLTSYGSCSITAAQAGNTNYLAADSVTQSFAIIPSGPHQTFDLYAVANNATIAGQSMPILGYTTGAAAAQPGGPPLYVNAGDVVVVTLHNMLAEPSSVLFQGQAMVPDTTGAAAGGTKTYIFTASQPGTFLYEAGLLANAQHQVAMGLYGALVVRPAVVTVPAQAYDNASTAYDDEAVLVLSEIDPALNTSANPAAFDMRDYAPKYFLINGKAYPDTATINSAAGDKLLLRYVNAGARHHSMAVLGLRQTFVAKDASLLPTLDVALVAETLAPGQTGDAIARIPAVTTESRFAVYDGSLMLHNNGAPGFGGMLTFVMAGSGTATTGPTTSAVALAPNPTTGSVPVNLTASLSSTGTIDAVEYFIDTTGSDGGGTAMSGTTSASATISVATLAGLAAGNHTFYVHGHDENGWGAFGSAVLNLDKAGPATSALVLTPNPSNGLVSVALSATANDTDSGGSNIAAAEYTIDGGTAVAMVVSPSGVKIASVTATIPSGQSPGTHVVSVRSQDSLGNWGSATTINLIVDQTGPTTSNVVAAPNPNNGALPFNPNGGAETTPALRVTASISDATSNIAAVETFIDTVGANGSGVVMQPVDGLFNSPSEAAYGDIPLTTIAALSDGNHTIYVHGKDAAGNWGATSSTTLVIDKTAPTISSVTLNGMASPATILSGTASMTLNVNATDGGTGLAGGQYSVDGSAPTAFAGTSTSISTGGLAGGTHTVTVQMKDGVGNLSAAVNVTLYVVQAVNDASSITANGSVTQTSDATAPGVLGNDQPVGVAARTAAIAAAPQRTAGGGSASIVLSCPGSLGTPGSTVGGSTLCTNGAYRVGFTGVTGNNNNQRAASKRGTFQFTYTETLNGVSSPATVTITVN
jgi:hypothetical protein